MKETSASTQRWSFYQNTAHLWKWARLDVFGTELGRSSCSFGSREESVADARRSGYRGYRLRSRATRSNAVSLNA